MCHFMIGLVSHLEVLHVSVKLLYKIQGLCEKNCLNSENIVPFFLVLVGFKGSSGYIWATTKMGSFCCCACIDECDEYTHPSNSIYRHCICLRFFFHQLLSGVCFRIFALLNHSYLYKCFHLF